MPQTPLQRIPAAITSLTLLGTLALAQADQPLPAGWTHDRLAVATYVILDPQIQGNSALIDPSQQQGVLKAMRKDSGDALKRHYPQAVLVTGTPGPDAIRVTPVLNAPAALVPWSKLGASLTFDLPEGARVTMVENFGLFTLWQHGAEAANYAFDQVAQRLP
ncbi:hypothetical protein [Deinococcus sp. KSM4-11]|uniref:hypothetical protein n=1 Tax=Deinococcus sp. KSM4-11 TaxID=2568654 RepID=UPI001F0ED258|nr:hypothetical protein [Deinococcus sp. KSM4-11]